MATQFITLDEAAKRLGIPVEEFKRRLKTEWTQIVPMRDGSNLRFRENQIEELARQMGAASDPGLPLAAMDGSDPGSEDFQVSSGPPKSSKRTKGKPADEPLAFEGSDDDIFSLSAEPAKPGKPSDQSHDSDVRLEIPRPKDGATIPTEEIALDLGGGPGSAVIKGGSSAKLSAPKSSANLKGPDSGKKLSSETGKTGSKANIGDSSEFELSLDADSDDFELQVNTDSSEEVDLGSSPLDEGGRAGKSGVNLRNPGDSGIPLDKARGSGVSRPAPAAKPPVDDSDDFELSLEADSDEAAPLGATGKPPAGKGRAPVTSDSDSEFELTLGDSGDSGSLGSLDAAALQEDEAKGDIFETDFEIPPMSEDSGSEAVALESDTDLEGSAEDVALDDVDVVAEDDSGSEAVVLDDDDEAPPSGRSGRRRGAAAALDDDEDASSQLAGVRGRRRDEEDDDEDDAVPSGYAPPTPWGPLPALFLFPAFVLLIVGGLMGYELLHTMTGYAQPRKPSAPIVRGIAKQLDKELRDQ
jgi:hypothetical protein